MLLNKTAISHSIFAQNGCTPRFYRKDEKKVEKNAPDKKENLYLHRLTKERQTNTDFFHNLYIVFPHQFPRLVGFFIVVHESGQRQPSWIQMLLIFIKGYFF